MPADRSQKREALLGTLAVAGMAGAFLLIFFLADLRHMLTPRDDLHVLMPSAAGLRAGSEVWIAGQTVGEVKDIDVRPPSVDSARRVAIQIEVQSKHREHIRQDSEARVTSAGLMGDAVLDISPGSASMPVIAPDDTLRFRGARTAEAAIASARSVQANLEQLVAEARVVSANARARSSQAARLRDQLVTMGREFEAFVVAVQEGPLNTFSDPEFQRIVSSMGASIGELRQRFAQAATRAHAARSDAAPALRRLSARADTISRALQQLQDAIDQSGGGLLVRAQRDSAIVKALHGAQAQLDSLIAETRRNPLRFWF
jgi:ABC-type transporter Mla subunit MlaD